VGQLTDGESGSPVVL